MLKVLVTDFKEAPPSLKFCLQFAPSEAVLYSQKQHMPFVMGALSLGERKKVGVGVGMEGKGEDQCAFVALLH